MEIAVRLLDADGERLFLVEAGYQDGQGQVVDRIGLMRCVGNE
jgi:hypothetical protein